MAFTHATLDNVSNTRRQLAVDGDACAEADGKLVGAIQMRDDAQSGSAARPSSSGRTRCTRTDLCSVTGTGQRVARGHTLKRPPHPRT
eukprot:597829-Prymnesium_polylepis.1